MGTNLKEAILITTIDNTIDLTTHIFKKQHTIEFTEKRAIVYVTLQSQNVIKANITTEESKEFLLDLIKQLTNLEDLDGPGERELVNFYCKIEG